MQGAGGREDMTSRGTCLRDVSVERQFPTMKRTNIQGSGVPRGLGLGEGGV
jgi:hypothetical protein